MIVPKALHQEFLRSEQDPGHAWHPEVNKMYASLRKHFDREAMVADVATYVSNCTSCAKERCLVGDGPINSGCSRPGSRLRKGAWTY